MTVPGRILGMSIKEEVFLEKRPPGELDWLIRRLKEELNALGEPGRFPRQHKGD